MSPNTEKELEALGEVEVSRRIGLHEYGVPGSEHRDNVEAWLRFKAIERANSAAAIERDALRTAKSAKAIAIAQIIVSAITSIVVVFIGYYLSSKA